MFAIPIARLYSHFVGRIAMESTRCGLLLPTFRGLCLCVCLLNTAVFKRLNRSMCRFGCRLVWAQRNMFYVTAGPLGKMDNFGGMSGPLKSIGNIRREIFFSSAHELLLASVLAVFLFFKMFLCICVLVLYLLVVRAACIDGCLCLSGSLPLLSCMLVLIVF